ncbi:hypothetical protein EVAR_83727_1 [Eumeta japonica]|uniref:Uncharacterized protein n=1 Tax=Eumeta variegata TaxID=151549 RepID=A0A4C1WD27_EUMVA|nr:hypothetical protein EVAR_83727_1 [Eumeta japonica]
MTLPRRPCAGAPERGRPSLGRMFSVERFLKFKFAYTTPVSSARLTERKQTRQSTDVQKLKLNSPLTLAGATGVEYFNAFEGIDDPCPTWELLEEILLSAIELETNQMLLAQGDD